jgi:DNA-binding NarL/FixJ family response regulator
MTIDDLPPTQRRVARLVAEHATHVQIARALDVTESAVRQNVYRICKRLGLDPRKNRRTQIAEAYYVAHNNFHKAAQPHAPAAVVTANDLSPRERLVTQMLTDGATNKQIARTVGATEANVASMVSRIVRRLGLDRSGNIRVRLALAYREHLSQQMH